MSSTVRGLVGLLEELQNYIRVELLKKEMGQFPNLKNRYLLSAPLLFAGPTETCFYPGLVS